jgi:peptide/nickel transport system permease protein
MKHKLFGLLRRIGLPILVVWTVVSLVTILIELVPGDPAVAVSANRQPRAVGPVSRQARPRSPHSFSVFPRRAWRETFQWYGLNNRYDDYWVAILHGDLGKSFRTDQPVFQLILERYPATIELSPLRP